MKTPAADIQLPLYRLFAAVRQLDRQAGHQTVDMPSYFLLLETLQQGYGFNSQDELLLLCEKLWLKPHHRNNPVLNREVLHRLFRETVDIPFHPDTAATDPTAADPGTPPPPTYTPPTLPPSQELPVPPSRQDMEISRESGFFSLHIGKAPARGTPESQLATTLEDALNAPSWLLKSTCFPVAPRRMEQHFRSLRFNEKSEARQEIDMDATIGQIARNGYFDHFALKRSSRQTTRWTLLIDNSDSMAAFSAFGEEMAHIIRERIPGNKGTTLYFRNVAAEQLYTHRQQPGFIPWDRFIRAPAKNILLFSDAGAARGFYNEDRIINTVQMLEDLKPHKVAWLNPMPKHRWDGSSAEMIAQFCPMFEIAEGSPDEMAHVISLFKSKIARNA